MSLKAKPINLILKGNLFNMGLVNKGVLFLRVFILSTMIIIFKIYACKKGITSI